MTTIYTVKGRDIPVFLEFHYDLNGELKTFKILEGNQFSEKLKQWIFHPERFPQKEEIIKKWKQKKNLEVTIGAPDLNFDNFWKLYNLKVGKEPSKKAWERLTALEKTKAFQGIKPYDGYLKRKGISKAYPQKYINQKKFNDEFNSLH